MAKQIMLQELENVTGNTVLISYGTNTIDALVGAATKSLGHYRTAGKEHAFKINMVQGNVSYVFNIYKTINDLVVHESISNKTANLRIDGDGGTYKIFVENDGIAIQETSSPYVLKYGDLRQTHYYHFLIADGDMEVVPSNNLNL